MICQFALSCFLLHCGTFKGLHWKYICMFIFFLHKVAYKKMTEFFFDGKRKLYWHKELVHLRGGNHSEPVVSSSAQNVHLVEVLGFCLGIRKGWWENNEMILENQKIQFDIHFVICSRTIKCCLKFHIVPLSQQRNREYSLFNHVITISWTLTLVVFVCFAHTSPVCLFHVIFLCLFVFCISQPRGRRC